MTPERQAALETVAARYAVAVPDALAQLIDRNDPDDPIARQFIPDVAELDHQFAEDDDPIGDTRTALLKGSCTDIPTGCCSSPPMSAPSIAVSVSAARWLGRASRIRSRMKRWSRHSTISGQHSEIWEVILTGGDPLILSARRMRSIMNALAKIDHVKVVRIHTRVPIADPARITRDLVRAMKIRTKATYVAVHVNHARELTADARAACFRIADAGIPLLSQTVLLAGVNDTPEVMGELMRALVECRIKPYYLHHGDMARGHRSFSYRSRYRAGTHARPPRQDVRVVSTDLRARHSRRSRQITDRPELRRARRFKRSRGHCCGGLQRAAAPLSAASGEWPTGRARPQRLPDWQSR